MFKLLKLPTNFNTEISKKASNRDSRNPNKYCNEFSNKKKAFPFNDILKALSKNKYDLISVLSR